MRRPAKVHRGGGLDRSLMVDVGIVSFGATVYLEALDTRIAS